MVLYWELWGAAISWADGDDKYYKHEQQPVYESTNNKLLRDLKIQTDNKIEHNNTNIVVLDKIKR